MSITRAKIIRIKDAVFAEDNGKRYVVTNRNDIPADQEDGIFTLDDENDSAVFQSRRIPAEPKTTTTPPPATGSKRKFYRTVISVELLTEEPIPAEVTLDDVHYQMTDGHASGVFLPRQETVLTGAQAAKALRAQGSATEFFQLDEHGNDVED